MQLRRVASPLLTGMFAAGRGIVWPTSAHAATFDIYTYYEIYLPYVSPSTPKCLDVPGGTTAPGAGLQIYHCHGYASNGAPQLFELISKTVDGATVYKIVNNASGECVAPGTTDPSNAIDSRVKQFDCTSSNFFEWYVAPDPANPGYDFKLRSWYYSDLCMGVFNTSAGDQAPVVLEPCNGIHDAMTWRFG
jgi:Ricin-type beta-trefoil lectin domain-like